MNDTVCFAECIEVGWTRVKYSLVKYCMTLFSMDQGHEIKIWL